MATTTATLLEAMAARIEALAPDAGANDDDVFRATIGTSPGNRGGRAVYLTAQPGRRLPTGGQTCSDWESVVQLDMVYPDAPAEYGQRGVYGRAVEDAEDVLEDLYSWAVSAADLLRFDPDIATIGEDGNGNIVVSRTIALRFVR